MSVSKTIVVKLGTSVLTGGSYTLDKAHMVELVRQCAQLRQQGHKVILVSSGAVAAGKEHLHMSCDLNNLANKQMLAAVGQSQLILTWQTLLKHHIVPIINENDAVATAEIKVGDNDNLSALTAILAQADQLLLLTDQPGLFTADPRSNPDATLITEVNKIDDNLRALAGGSGTNLGTGGMATKLQAADAARRAGIETIIAAGHRPNVIIDTINQTGVGTRFKALESAIEGRKRWLLAGPSSSGKLVLDAGATDAIVLQGSSLLAKGVKQVKGLFERGDLVELVTVQGEVIAKGICRYSSIDLDKIKTLHSEQIKAVLGFDNGKVVIHRDDLVLLDD